MKLCAALLLPIALAACVSAPSTEELNPKVMGMSRAELLSCMGPPNNAARDGNMEFLTYSHRNFHGQYTYRCDANWVLTDGRVTRLRVTGDEVSGLIDVTSGVCRAMVAKCVK
jgi:hypothetical protein